MLHELGVDAASGESGATGAGFPLAVPLSDGNQLLLELPEPGLLASLDPDNVGAALLDGAGKPIRVWGLARKVRFFRAGQSVLSTEIGSLIASAHEGIPGSLYLDGFRFHVSGFRQGSRQEVFVLITSAGDERQARKSADRNFREASALRRLGRVLTMNTVTQQLCVSAVHEISAAWELAAVLLWTLDRDTDTLSLSASTGANRQGVAVVSHLNSNGAATCLAELVAQSMQPAFFPNVRDTVMTSELEARFCYLNPGGVSVHPLVIGGQVLGVLELIGRDSDVHFGEAQEFFQTVAEHLALALHGAHLFESFERLASHDPLTGIANHRTLQEFLRNRIAEAQRSKVEVGAIMIDVDHFRRFNEDEGHDTGDQVLKQVAEAIRSTVRSYDIAARYGGEEFTAILPNANRDTTLMIAERIRKKVSAIPIVSRLGKSRPVTVSVGCAVYPGSAEDGPNLLRAADQALYEAKRLGRNKVVFFSGELGDGSPEDEWNESLVWNWVPNRLRKPAATRLNALERQLLALCRMIGLSRLQWHVLRASIIMSEAYFKAKRARKPEALTKLEEAEDLRVIWPTLTSIGERFDGRGPEGLAGDAIPLLARVAAVLLCLESEGGSALYKDSGRFDPEIVAMVSDLELAA